MMELEINYEELERFRKIFQILVSQLQADKMVADGSKMHKEDVTVAALVCVFAKLYKPTEK